MNYNEIVSKQIFHLPHIHGGFSTALAQGERAIGLKSKVIGEKNIYSAPPDILLSALNLKNPQTVYERYKAFRIASSTADIIHFNYGSSLLDPPLRNHFLLDLPFYPKHLRKIMTFQGSDIRMAYAPVMLESRSRERSLGHKLPNNTTGGIISENEVTRKRALSKKIDKHMDCLFALNPDLLTGLPNRTRFLPYPHVLQAASIQKIRKKDAPLKIVHMATNRVLKGTGLIEYQLSELSRVYNIATRIIVKQPHKVAAAALEWADILIDQVCLGWYGAQAVEALALSKPVLCYLDPAHRRKFLPSGNIGFIETDHNGIPQALSAFCENPALLEKYGQAGRAFVKDFHDPQKLARYIYKDWIEN